MAEEGALKKTFGWVSGFLFSEEPARKPAPPLAGSYAAKFERPGQAQSLPAPGRLAAGALQLLGLEPLRQALGPEWDARRDRIHRAIEGVLRRRLDITDAFYRVQGDNYLILFTRLGRTEAQFKTRVISGEIQKLILGEEDNGAALVVTYQVTEVDRKLVLERTESPEEMMAAVVAAAAVEGAKPQPAPAGNVTGDAAPDLGALFKGVSAEQYVKTRMAAFRPMLEVRTLKFSSFMTTTAARSDRPSSPEEDIHLVEDPENLPALLDRFLLDASMMALHRVLQTTYRTQIVIPITYETLASKQLRDAYFTRLKAVPSGLKGFIAFRVTDVPAGIPPARLADILAQLKPLSGLQIIDVPLDPALVDSFASARCPAFSADMPPEGKEPPNTEARLRNFVKRATAHGAQSYIGGVDTSARIRSVLTAGTSILYGDAVSTCVPTPGPIGNLKLRI